MRIAIFHNVPSGGAKRAIFEWMKRLAANHDIDVYTLSTADHDFCDIRPYVQQHRIIDFLPRPQFNTPLGRLNQLQRWRDLGDLIRIGQKLAREIDAGKYDIVFTHTCQFTFMPSLLRYLGTPSVYYLHEPFGHTFIRYIQRPYDQQNPVRDSLDQVDPLIKLYRQRLHSIQRNGIAHTALLLANSQFTQAEIEKSFAVKTTICHYGVDVDAFQPQPETRKGDFVLSVGELSPRKGFDFIVNSLAQIPAAVRPQLRLACNRIDPIERQYIEKLAHQKKVDLRVLTNLNTAQLNFQYNTACLCVYTPVQEPFGLVPLEAMACGTAVVGIREGGLQESVLHEQTGILVDRDPALFAHAVQQLLSDPRLTEQYGRNGREHVLAHWTWQRSAAKVENHLCTCSEAHS